MSLCLVSWCVYEEEVGVLSTVVVVSGYPLIPISIRNRKLGKGNGKNDIDLPITDGDVYIYIYIYIYICSKLI